MTKGLLITPTDDGYVVKEFDGGLPEMQAAVGGYVEVIPTDESVTIWVAEDGKFTGLPANRLAMDCWIRWDIHYCMLRGGDWIAGPALFTGGVGAQGESLDLPPGHRHWVLRVARDAGAAIS
jgi:hypothetical protein